jgi:hypothetical protein
MKDIIRMNQLAGIITEGQARKMMQVLNEEGFTDFLHNDYGPTNEPNYEPTSGVEYLIYIILGDQKWKGQDIRWNGTIKKEWIQRALKMEKGELDEMATLINKNSSLGSEKPLQVGDTIMWKTYSNDDRGMGSSVSGRIIGKVVKILGSANLQAEDIKTGNLYKVSRNELIRVPNVGDKIEATLSYNSGAGSGSQGSNKISGTVKKVNPEKFSMTIQNENSDKPSVIDLKNLSDVKIY